MSAVPRSSEPRAVLAAALEVLDARLSTLVSGLQDDAEEGVLPGFVLTEAEVQRGLFAHGEEPAPFSIIAKLREGLESDDLGPMTALQRRFDLSDLEVDAVITCVALELSPHYAQAFGFLNDDLTKKFATPALILRLFGQSLTERRCLIEGAPLLDAGLLRVLHATPIGTPQIAMGLGVDETVVRFLEGQTYFTPSLRVSAAREAFTQEQIALWKSSALHERLDHILTKLLENDLEDAPLIVHLYGREGAGRRFAYASLVASRGLVHLPPIDCPALLGSANPIEAMRTLFRDAALASCPVFLHRAEAFARTSAVNQTELAALIDRYAWLVFMSFSERQRAFEPWMVDRGALEIHVPVPDLAERDAAWAVATEREELPSGVREALAAKFVLTEGQIAGAVRNARLEQSFSSPEKRNGMHLQRHAARVSAPALGRLGQRIRPGASMRDIVLPAPQKDALADIVRHVRHRPTVRDEWCFGARSERGQGLHALFAGPPGTGKTMAAEVVANELGMEMYRIDLSAVVSKYIGETEKNLSAIFQEAEGSNAILFFDEADALFGRRSETRDAHDRYANIEVNYLLQAIEGYDGVSILATNFRQNLDPAFIRRMRIILEFPVPAASERKEIWARVFPDAAPIEEDLDFEFLATSFDFCGGSIHNVGLTAAYLAAESGENIGMPHLVRATQRELQKLGKRFVAQQFAPYEQWLETRGLETRA